MPLPKGCNPNRPAPGSRIKVGPIRSKKAITQIKAMLNRRDRCLFTLSTTSFAFFVSAAARTTAGAQRRSKVEIGPGPKPTAGVGQTGEDEKRRGRRDGC